MGDYRALATAFRLGSHLTGAQLGRLHKLASEHGNYLLAARVRKVERG